MKLEKPVIKKINYGKAERYSFAKTEIPFKLPNLLEMQKNSYEKFLTEYIWEVIQEFNPIVDYSNKAELTFLDYSIERVPKFEWAECKKRQGAQGNYTIPLKVKARLLVKETGQIIDQQVFLGDIPYMNENGEFLFNGVERVILGQLVKSPGVFFDSEVNKSGHTDYSSSINPVHGMYIATEQVAGDCLRVTLTRKFKLSLGVFLKCFGFTNEQLLDIFANHPFIKNTLEKEPQVTQDEALIEFSKRTRPGEIPSAEESKEYIQNLFFTQQYYNLSKVGRYMINKKLNLATRIAGKIAKDDITFGRKTFVKAGEVISPEVAVEIQNAGINTVDIIYKDKACRVIGNNRVDLRSYLDIDPKEVGITELVYYPLLRTILKENKTKDAQIKAVKANARKLEDFQLTLDDLIGSTSYLLNLIDGFGSIDVKDHLANKRVACCGELLMAEFRKGMTKLKTQVMETLQSRDLTDVSPSQILNARHINKAIKEFIATSQLAPIMDQDNPISTLTHKRRLSSSGPGGVKKERATAEVRDINHTHYGRICIVETPEGQSIGLVSSLASYARVNDYGFIEAPYRRIDKKTGKVTDDIVYLTADQDEQLYIGQANEPLNPDHTLANKRVVCRNKDTILEVNADQVDMLDLSPSQLVSITTNLIPFIENDDTNRALMGTNMQRQAVPLLQAESPIIGTGVESKIARDSGAMIIADGDGVVTYVSGGLMKVKYDDGRNVEYKLEKFMKTNNKTCFNQKPLAKKGERVKAGDVIADGASTKNGELAIGKNLTVAFMNWEGYNYEDAILVSDRITKEDVFTSITLMEKEIEARTTKLGDEEITRDIPGVSEESLKNLDEDGIIKIGTEVRTGDILVGKVTPKGETELSPEERLLKAIFGEKTKDVRNSSLKVDHGESGVVVGIEKLSRKNKDELAPGVNSMIKVYIAQKSKLQVGDKLCGRHGNKGCVSMILPAADMPYMPNGEPVDVVLNPLGIPSRMNIGQVLEVHLGLVAKQLGWHVATPGFDGATAEEIQYLLKENNLPEDGKIQLYDGRTGEKFENRSTVGVMYMLKLDHMVEAKIHARSIGPYALITQQPLNGRAQFGGQRFGEMEVWALEAYGASHLLQEMLTVKSDDVEGRQKTYEAIVKGYPIPEPGMPESFKVLVKEMQGLCMDISLLTADGHALTMNEVSNEDVDTTEIQPINKTGLEDITLEFDELQSEYEDKAGTQTFDESALFDDIDE